MYEESIQPNLSFLLGTQSKPQDTSGETSHSTSDPDSSVLISPAVRVLLETYHLNPRLIPATGPKGRLLKGDVLRYVAQGGQPFTKPEEAAVPVKAAPLPKTQPTPQPTVPTSETGGK